MNCCLCSQIHTSVGTAPHVQATYTALLGPGQREERAGAVIESSIVLRQRSEHQ